MKLPNSRLTAVLMLALTVGVAAAHAELLKVEQVVFGMDCAPCAYGLETSLKKLPGVKTVSVSLNRGTATIELKPGNQVTVEDIKAVVRKNGFTPKETKILEGTEPAKAESAAPKR